jgi:cobyrinic acid a,c-diamide synthase
LFAAPGHPAIVELARSAGDLPIDQLSPKAEPVPMPGRTIRLGIARDEAFHFYYPDNLEELARLGAEWVPFSPLADRCLPPDLDGLYLGGGYPELHAARLAENTDMLADVRDYAASGRVLYAECGGMMYLGRTLTTNDGAAHAMAGVLPIQTAMLPRLKVLGYAEVCWDADSLWGSAGEAIRGHEFHYSEMVHGPEPTDAWQSAYTVCRRRGHPETSGFSQGNILAGYVHLHWASRPAAAARFLSHCRRSS